ncbi:ribosome maturation protein sbds-like [Stylonychia lemnae]|uniref:Ribosome maturation protein sbds-like n=1 Tax=Stylonychia lemnae TaxID=5949 RepID=A0A078A9Z9_STYLE|nr:ribosome maturation protein sbds-like [Stylonychia lemnae]|eukprot:CDW78721.1 ribosome maturation protein sbds-like [Stylonychia lemnae]
MIKTPVNQIRLTNVAIIRLKKGGKRFEIACYKNKAVNWRNKQESNLSEVLQIDKIYTNVSKGEIANKKDFKVFGDLSYDEIIMEILNKGDLQVSELERDDQLDNLKKEIANIIAQKCVNTTDGKQFPVSIIMKAMNEVNAKINPKQTAKKQALDFIGELKKVIPIERAKMRLKISFESQEQQEKMKDFIEKEHQNDCEIERLGERLMQLQIQPNMFRELSNVVKENKEFYNGVVIEIQDQQVVQNAEQDAEEEVKQSTSDKGSAKKKKKGDKQ